MDPLIDKRGNLFIVRKKGKSLRETSLAWWWQQKLKFYYNFHYNVFLSEIISVIFFFCFALSFPSKAQAHLAYFPKTRSGRTALFISSFIEWKELLFIIIWFLLLTKHRHQHKNPVSFTIDTRSADINKFRSLWSWLWNWTRFVKLIRSVAFLITAGNNPLVPTESSDDHCNKTVDIYVDVASPPVTYLNRYRPLTCWYRFKSIRGIPKDWVLRLTFKKFKVGTLINATHCEGGYLQVSIKISISLLEDEHNASALHLYFHKHHVKLENLILPRKT